MNNTFESTLPHTTRLDPLDQAKEALEASQRGLEQETKRIEVQLEALRQAQDMATSACGVAEARLTTVLMVVEKLCDDCFSIMPFFSENDLLAKLSSRQEESTGGGTCISCGQPLQDGMNLCADSVELLPPPPALLQKAREALDYCNALVDGLEQGRGLLFPEHPTNGTATTTVPRTSTLFLPSRSATSATASATDTTGSSRLDMEFLQSRMDYLESRFGRGLSLTHAPTLTNAVPSMDPARTLSARDVHERIHAAMGTNGTRGSVGTDRTGTMSWHANSMPGNKTRQDCVLAADKAVVVAANRQQEITEAIALWKRYQKQILSQLQEVRSAITNMQLRVRKTLQDKIDALGGTLSQRCIICEERGKDIVFQCGHRSCAPCGTAIVKCHTCRVTITQRIKIFD